MNIKIKLLIVFLLGFAVIKAQEPLEISGKVVDATNEENLAFVNIGIEGTLIGTASNADGDFSLKVPAEYAQKNLYFSAIGYQNMLISIPLFRENDGIMMMQPLSYGINDVEITTQSKVLYRIVRDAANAIPQKFVHVPYGCQALYQNEVYVNQVLTKKRDAIVAISDSTGYGNTKNAFASINYQFLNVQRNFEVKSLANGTTLMDELLSFDLARSPGNILNLDFLNDYDLDLAGSTAIEGDSVWIVAYRLGQPDLSRTGDINATLCEGKLYISKKNNVLLKAEAIYSAPKQSTQGRTVVAEHNNALTEVNYRFITTYKDTENGYVLDRIVMNKSYKNKKSEPCKSNASLMLLKVNTAQPVLVQKRQYFEKMLSDPDFWTANKQQ